VAFIKIFLKLAKNPLSSSVNSSSSEKGAASTTNRRIGRPICGAALLLFLLLSFLKLDHRMQLLEVSSNN